MKDISYYRKLPYTRRARLVEDDGEAYFVAFVEELPALEIDAPTREEAFLRLDEMFDDYVRAQIEWGDDIPEPAPWPGTAGLPHEPKVRIGYAIELLESAEAEEALAPNRDLIREQWRAGRELEEAGTASGALG